MSLNGSKLSTRGEYAGQAPATRAKIMIVDDDEINVEVLPILLRDEHELAIAQTAEECLEKLEQFAPDLVLLDIMMPGLDGYESCRRIKADCDGDAPQVILVSGKASTPERLQGYEVGADDYLVKPFDHDELLAKVRVQIRLRSALRELRSAHDRIHQHNEQLDAMVQQRTGELMVANESLRREVSERNQAREELRQTNAEMAAALQREKGLSMELQAAMQQYAAARKDAEAANRAKSEFLANMSHEIRTPMTAILGYTEELIESSRGRERTLDSLDVIKRNGEQLLQIINGILDLSKIEAGKFELEQVACSPATLIADVQSLMSKRAAAKELDLRIEYDGPIPEVVRTDPTRLRQIIINLVGNAVKFTERGCIRIVTRLIRSTRFEPDSSGAGGEPRPADRILAELPAGNLLRIDVIDTGVGIEPSIAEVLFQPFVQADSSTTRSYGGTGLGLTISKRLANMLGGDITVASEPGKGSTFSVLIPTGPLDGVKMLDDPLSATLPDVERAAGSSPRGAAQAEAGGSSKLDCRILLVEDSPDLQRLVAAILRQAGAEVEVVENGQEAVKRLLPARAAADIPAEVGSSIDLVLMDMQMPVLDGYAATRTLRRDGYGGPVIALTAHAMAADRQKCLQAGCDDHVAKPIEKAVLFKAISRCLSAEHAAERRTRQVVAG